MSASRRAGFTLLELLIVIVVGMIIAGAAIPSAHTIDDRWVSADACILQADLEFAQARAIATGQSHRVLFAQDRNLYKVESPPGVLLEEPLSKKKWRRELAGADKAGTHITAVDFAGAAAVIFDAAGRPSASGSVTFELGEFKAVVTVEAVTGKVTLDLP
ncbi:MAG: prepilin-type N-terminal cleavage/methylation domain-containing protein [Planctomycetes bacterium]|nr:prepilin-type N-terminal cleavage/methylation domain-containing protein [Planctomycetota bacterium]